MIFFFFNFLLANQPVTAPAVGVHGDDASATTAKVPTTYQKKTDDERKRTRSIVNISVTISPQEKLQNRT